MNIPQISFCLSPSHKDFNQSINQLTALVSRVEGLSASPTTAILVLYSNQHLVFCAKPHGKSVGQDQSQHLAGAAIWGGQPSWFSVRGAR